MLFVLTSESIRTGKRIVVVERLSARYFEEDGSSKEAG